MVILGVLVRTWYKGIFGSQGGGGGGGVDCMILPSGGVWLQVLQRKIITSIPNVGAFSMIGTIRLSEIDQRSKA